MSTPFTDSVLSTQIFDESNAADILHQAVARRAPVQMEIIRDQTKTVCRGELIGCKDSVLSILVQCTNDTSIESLSGETCKIFFEVSGNRYVFQSRLTELSTDSSSKTIVVQKPETVCLVERRRTLRRRLRQCTYVHLRYTQGDTSWRCRATMLNASEHGLACRLERQDVRSLAIGQSLQVVFQLGSHSQPFRLTASVINITNGGSEEQSVLGIEFEKGHQLDAQRSRLKDAIRMTM